MKRAHLIVALLFSAACSHGTHVEPSNATEHDPVRTDGGVAIQPTPTTATDPTVVAPPAPPQKVKIMIRTTPPKGVFVSWGRKKLGVTPMNIERPRDSGPMDLVLRADGYFPMHTRAYTVKNDIIGVKMVKLEDRMTVFGAKQEIPPDNVPADPSLDPANALKPAPSTPPAPLAPTPVAPTP